MVVFHCTQRLVRRFHLVITDTVSASTGVLGDWYANLIQVGSVPWVLCQSEHSLLPVLVRARKDAFPAQFGATLEKLLRRLGIPEGLIARELEAATDIGFARPDNRRILGVLNDFGSLSKDYLGGSTNDLQAAVEVCLKLAETPASPIGLKSPDQVAIAMFRAHGTGQDKVVSGARMLRRRRRRSRTWR